MSFSVSDGRGEFEWAATPAGPVRQPRPHRRPVVSPDALRPPPLLPRGAGADRHERHRGPRCGSSASRARLLRVLRRAADRASGLGGLVGGPGAAAGASRPASSPSSSPTTARCSCSAGRAGARSPAARAATWTRSRRRSRRGSAPPHPVRLGRTRRRRRCRDRGGTAGCERFDEVVVRLPLRPGAGGCWPIRRRRRARGARRDRLPGERDRAPHGQATDAPPPRGLGELELSPHRRVRRAHDRDLPHEPPPVARRGSRVPGHAQPHRGHRSGAGDPPVHYAHPVYTPRGGGRPGALGGGRAAARTHFCGAYWRWGFHEDGVWSALRACGAMGALERGRTVAPRAELELAAA